MTHRKLLYTLLFFFSLSIIFSSNRLEAHATNDSTVFYKNEAGEQLIAEKVNQISTELQEVDAVVGTFSSKDIKELKKSSDVVVVEKNEKKLQIQATTTDLSFKNNATNWNQTMVKASKAWGIGLSGSKIKVGIIDTAVATHTSLPTIKKKTFISDRTEINTAASAAKHGTSVAGIIAAQPATNSKIIGIAPNVTLYNMNINGKSGADLADFAAAVDYAIQEKIEVLNISMGIPKSLLLDEGEKLTDSPIYIAVKKALNAGIIVVAASGNNGVDIDYPAAIPGVIAVGSVASDKNISYFSNKGSSLSLVAPGSNVLSLDYLGGTRNNSGTSFAAPHVTGLIALLKQQYPAESTEKIKNRLLQNATDLGATGFDTVFGNGLAVFPDINLLSSGATETLTASQKYVQSNSKTIKSIITKIKDGKTVKYTTEFMPVFTVNSNLTASQQKVVNNYKKTQGMTVISKDVKSAKIKATNLTTLKTKKSSKITFTTKLKASTVKANTVTMYKNGQKFTGFTVTKAKNGSYITVKTTKSLSKGVYYVAIDTATVRTASNKKVKPYIVQYAVK